MQTTRRVRVALSISLAHPAGQNLYHLRSAELVCTIVAVRYGATLLGSYVDRLHSSVLNIRRIPTRTLFYSANSYEHNN